MEQIAVISSPRLVRVDGGGGWLHWGYPDIHKNHDFNYNISWSFFFGFGTQKTCTKKTSNTWVILCDGAEIAAENSHALKQETSIWHRAIHGSAGIKGFIGKSNLIQCASTILLGWKRSSFLPQTFKPNTVFPAREPWETLFFSTKKQPSVTLHDSSAAALHALQDMLVSTRLTPSQRWTLLESSKRSLFCFFFGVFQSLFWKTCFSFPQWQRVSGHGDYTSIYQRLYYYTIWIMIAAIWTSLSTRT